MKTILLTGASGFLGSHLAEDLSSHGYKIIALIRKDSDLWRCNEFKSDTLVYIYYDANNLKGEIEKFAPSVFIHTAWHGVAVKERQDWSVQVENVAFYTRLLVLAHELGIKKIISFGSQAEYGNFNGRIKEEAPCNPATAYGAAKLASLDVFKSFCEIHSINWFWFRLFSLYGTREGYEWLIPSVIQHTYNNKPMNLTKGEQRYDYLYVKDFTRAIIKVIESENAGNVFNLTSDSSMTLRDVIEKIGAIVNPKAELNFGALPYRAGQVMHMEGDATRFNRQFNFSIDSAFEKNIKEVTNYYIAKLKV